MSKKFKVGIDLKCNIKNDCKLFYLNDFKDYDFYNKLSARDAVRTKVYNILAGKQNALNREEFGNTWNDINREILDTSRCSHIASIIKSMMMSNLNLMTLMRNH